MNKRIALATALTFAALTVTPAAADVVTVTGPIEGLDITQTTNCGSISVTMVVNRTNDNDVIEGTEFTLEKLADIDLTTQEGWDAVKGMAVDKARLAPKVGKWTATTDAQGKARFDALPVGAYFVTAVVPNDGKHLTPAPFVITLPTGGKDGWNCNPEINAKFEPVPVTTTPTKPPYPPFTPPVPVVPVVPVVPSTTSEQVPPRDSVVGLHQGDSQSRPRDQVFGIDKRLASTGAAVIGVVTAAVGLLALGILLVRRRKEEK